ncbi:hypothetical protein N8737_04760 [Verrucomicrobia bacterium]|nr:hypothetical protein [Verrucomicrobiota bacterium]MDA7657989.1 hypothetical protein [Verrucomicrobiota bacterium]
MTSLARISLSTVWVDSTALKVNIHIPVDWVLLRNPTVTLMKATELIYTGKSGHGILLARESKHEAEVI